MTYRNTLITLTLGLTACGFTSNEPIVEQIVATPIESADIAEVADTDEPAIVEASPDALEPEWDVYDEDEPEPLPPTATFALRRGETLAHFARWSGLPVEVIAETSGLDLFDTFAVGTEIRVPISGEPLAELATQRDLHHVRRAEGYLAARGGALGTEFYTVQTGDSAWTIARDQRGIPVWLLETYNPSSNLDNLRPGEELMVPIIADIVVDAGDLE